MSYAEVPAETDAEQIKAELQAVKDLIENSVLPRLDNHADGINALGANVQWIVQNAQGIFQMFASPQFMSQMTNVLMGGMNGAGQQPEPESASAGPESTGADA